MPILTLKETDFFFCKQQVQLDTFEVCNDIDQCLHRLEFDDKLVIATSRHHIRSVPIRHHARWGGGGLPD